MRRTVVCCAPYGTGGLGQHLAQVVEESRANGQLDCYYAVSGREGDPAARTVGVPWLRPLCRCTPVRFSPGWQSYAGFDLFDRAVATRLGRGDTLNAFAGQPLHSFRAARRLGYEVLELEAPNSHVRNVRRQHALAIRRHGMEESWLNEPLARRIEQAYAAADVIYANSEYTRQSLIAEGVPHAKVLRRRLLPDPRFRPAPRARADGIFRIVYVGSLTVPKGIPDLIEAFSRLPARDVELTLVGGYTTRGMHRYIDAWRARDPRIRLAPGDPLPHLQRADVCVHPSYEDGFAYAPAEALACGVPVVVTEDTGMKELVREGETGYVVPTGSWKSLLERLRHLYCHPLTPAAEAMRR